MNVFDSSEWDGNPKRIKNNMLIYIRILQYIENEREKCNDSVKQLDIIDTLSSFYEKSDLKIAIKKLIYAKILLEVVNGTRDIEVVTRWQEVDISDPDISFSTEGSGTSALYLRYLVIEPEYLFNVSITLPIAYEPEDTLLSNFFSKYSEIGNDLGKRI